MLLRWFKYIVYSALFVIAIIIFYLLIPIKIKPAENIKWGVTFTKSYAEYLGLDWRQAYLAVLDELELDMIRLGINWDEIEPTQGQFDFTDFDWMFAEAEKRNIDIVPAIGFKLPRWPECRAPQWVRGRPHKEIEQDQLSMLKAVVEHFKAWKNIKIWQVENEAFIGWFGDCPPISDSFVREEVKFVRSLDSRPILMTESGELSTGLKSALAADIVGTSLYRQVWSPVFGFITYPLPPSFYSHKAKLLKLWASRFVISELQLEAWAPQGILNMPVARQLEVLNQEKMKEYIDYARRTGVDEIYTWGVEWWWWLKQQGHPQLWETAKEEFTK